jgi:hypothetical protein
VLAAVAQNDDCKPYRFGSANAAFAFFGYSELIEYVSDHVASTGKPFVACGLPIATPGAIGAENTSGNTGTGITTLVAGANGCMTEHDGEVTVLTGGTIGTDQIVIGVSLDGGRTVKRVRLGTASSYAIPYVGVTINFAAGTLLTGETIHTWHASGPLCDTTGIDNARVKLGESSVRSRSWLLLGDATPDVATALNTAAENYATANYRYIMARAGVRDMLQYCDMSKTHVRSTAATVTFAEVGATGDTITRGSGSFITDGFAVGDMIVVSGSASNNFTAVAKLTAVTATVLTLNTDDLVAEGPVAATIIGYPSLTFANSAETITRNRGSWLDDGFRVGQLVTVTGAGSNNAVDKEIVTLTATVMTLESGGVTADAVASTNAVTITAGETKAAWIAAVDSEYSGIDGASRLSLGAGRARKMSLFTGYMFRRNVQWAACVREYQHDVHVATWNKDNGPLTGWTIEDENNVVVEYNDRTDGEAASAARFTSFRTWSNGPGGVAIALDLTRAEDGSVLSYVHNVAVVNLAQAVVQNATESLIGSRIELNDDGTPSTTFLTRATGRVNGRIAREVLKDIGEGTRASRCLWTPNADDDLSGAESILTGVLDTLLNGTVHTVNTEARVR